MDESNRQERNRAFVQNNVICCQSMLVDEMLKKDVFNYEDIINITKTEKELLDEGYSREQIEAGDIDEYKEIFEWWIVSDFMLEELKALSEPVLENDYGEWWGRTCTGQAILMDGIIDEIIKKRG